MALRISGMEPIPSLSNEDLMMVTKNSDNKTYSASMQNLKNYLNLQQNGGFRGETTDSLATLAVPSKVGSWLWTPSSPETIQDYYGSQVTLSQGFVTVSTYKNPADAPTYLVQKVDAPNGIFERCVVSNNINSAAWRRLDNRANMIMDCGMKNASDSESINFTQTFPGVPMVFTQVVNNDNEWVYSVEVRNPSQTGFTLKILRSAVADVVTEETSTESTDPTTHVTTKTTTVETTHGKWEVLSGSIGIRWFAVMYAGDQS